MATQAQLAALQQGTYGASGEILEWSYYDRATLAAAGTDISLFQNPIGSTAAAKTLADTNMTSPGSIPQGQNFKVRAIRAEYGSHASKASADIDTLYNWMLSANIRVFITGKDALFSKPLTEVMGIPLLWHTVPTVAGNNEIISSFGRFNGVSPLNIPIILAALTPFEVRLSFPTALGGGSTLIGDFVKVSLLGILTRAS